MSFDEMLEDSITIENTRGEQLGPIKGSIVRGQAHLLATQPVERGDILIRKMPLGNDERWVVKEPNYMHGMGDLPAMYQADIQREDTSPEASRPASSITYNFYGNHARLNQHSTDSSINITIDSNNSVFEDLKSELRSRVDDPQRIAELEAIISDMQASQYDSKSMSEKLGQLISKGSDLMGIIGPFVPMLTGIATGASS